MYICQNHTYSAYVRLHSCVALHLALSMNAAANFCSLIKHFATILIYLCSGGGGGIFFTLPEREGGRGREGGREGGRWRVNGSEGFSVLCMLSQFQAVHFMREYNICTLYVCVCAGS